MFTGLIEGLGKIAALERRGGDVRLRIDAGTLSLADVGIGDSIAVSGVCLTVIENNARTFSVDVSAETLACTTLDDWKQGDGVNLEKALLPTTRLGGHLVSGHVDGVGSVERRSANARSIEFRFEAPAVLAKYIAQKGSICIDGVSLTVNQVDGAQFEVMIIPHTAAMTTLGALERGARVNLEVDVLARYLERLLQGEKELKPDAGVTHELLARHGFLK